MEHVTRKKVGKTEKQCPINQSIILNNLMMNTIRFLALGETCDRSGDCFVNGDPERVECRNSVCQCQFHYKPDGETQKCVKSGESKYKDLWNKLL